ncbi:aspartate--tRNA ligase [Roseinatronobacter bogoriensis]|uniref:Aspartate--tRNA(Asp/Asn) ligase n=1 Tax=Roseinatronobacter bogoriensis subsp. barguzinensis TaxID=441209 RepID=A0A2K8KD26_9RHOB|nr:MULTISPECIES: aspartate--tRNA ligase [Rhodobaca]ATX67361.1 aspartate--tRNA ligase [Rhodobaca barguzinensis]MBB4206932.1 aspartyl-tRNA synthetase [Rhodobaca bogoriensis DSM 18756]TDW41675.1 aspartyl-tRNA synthetase [Rhodobaca barguzinensis]TDY74146.1 aspartyl-tRNA synthetase [Rhodobaca bogoriensis DSM 18756]
MHAYRSHTCADLTAAHVGETVRLSGWVHRIRDHGGVLFIDLRDHFGITQVLADSDSAAFKDIEKLRAEYCIRIEGTVKARDASLINSKLKTGEIEVYARSMDVLGAADDLPLPVFGEPDYPEETRLAYRFLDLRRDGLHANMMLRSNVVRSMRNRMWDTGFTEFQTPIITASSPEGARDFLVPSRLHPGKFYALPQAPQQFKQLIMVSGFDKYFQIAPCFRDEDPRADRSPTDFYQLDVEMSFVEQEDVFSAVGPVLQGVFEEFAGDKKVDPCAEWPRIPYAESLLKYGSDKPDLRNPIEMQVVSEHFRGSGFAIFAKLLENEGTEIRAIPAPTGGSRKFCDRMNSFAQAQGLPGMGYIFWRAGENGLEAAGPLAKNIGPERTEAIRTQLGLGEGDAAFFLGGKPAQFEGVAAKARDEIGRELKLVDENRFAFAWIVDFPMYEADAETGKVDFSHNPFSMPQGGMAALEGDPLAVKGYQYDLACNGYEILSGAIRNHKPEIMYRAFEIAGYPNSEVDKRFGGMVKAFKFGAPPHGGCAAGIDRIVMLLADEANIRQVIMFPMNQRAEDLLLEAPSVATNEQLRDLGLRIAPKD